MISARFESREFSAAIKRLQQRGIRLSRPLNACGEILLTSIDKNFEAQGRYSSVGDIRGGSTRWKPLAAATKLQRIGGSKGFKKNGELRKISVRKLSKMKILQRSGQLAASFTKEVSGNTLTIGTNRIDARKHHKGGYGGRGKTVYEPARPILVVQREDEDDMLDILERHMEG